MISEFHDTIQLHHLCARKRHIFHLHPNPDSLYNSLADYHKFHRHYHLHRHNLFPSYHSSHSRQRQQKHTHLLHSFDDDILPDWLHTLSRLLQTPRPSLWQILQFYERFSSHSPPIVFIFACYYSLSNSHLQGRWTGFFPSLRSPLGERTYRELPLIRYQDNTEYLLHNGLPVYIMNG